MRIFTDRENQLLLGGVAGATLLFAAAGQGLSLWRSGTGSLSLLLLFLGFFCVQEGVCLLWLLRQDRILERAARQVRAALDGDPEARIDCDREGQLCRLFQEVNTLASVLAAHAERENREKEFLRTMISDISHQLKTPLTALGIYVGLLREETEDNAGLREFVELSEGELERMETLVRNLLKLARLDAGAVQMEMHPENLAALMEDLAARYARRAEREGRTLRVEGPEEVDLLCDRDWLLEALDNLVKNALDHTTAGDSICLRWQRTPASVQIRVEDSGHGIHPEDLPHIFKRFYRSRFSRDSEGAGLGLPLAKAIVEAHRGTLEVRSDPGRGTCFTVSLLIPTDL